MGEANRPTNPQQVPAAAIYRTVVEQVPAILWTTDAELRITLATGGGLTRAGLAGDQLVGATVFDVTPHARRVHPAAGRPSPGVAGRVGQPAAGLAGPDLPVPSGTATGRARADRGRRRGGPGRDGAGAGRAAAAAAGPDAGGAGPASPPRFRGRLRIAGRNHSPERAPQGLAGPVRVRQPRLLQPDWPVAGRDPRAHRPRLVPGSPGRQIPGRRPGDHRHRRTLRGRRGVPEERTDDLGPGGQDGGPRRPGPDHRNPGDLLGRHRPQTIRGGTPPVLGGIGTQQPRSGAVHHHRVARPARPPAGRGHVLRAAGTRVRGPARRDRPGVPLLCPAEPRPHARPDRGPPLPDPREHARQAHPAGRQPGRRGRRADQPRARKSNAAEPV